MKTNQKALAVLVWLTGATLFYWATTKAWYFTQLVVKEVEDQMLLQDLLVISVVFSGLVFFNLSYALLRAGFLDQAAIGWFVTMAILLFGPALLEALGGLNVATVLVLLIAAIAMPWVFMSAARRRKRNNHPTS